MPPSVIINNRDELETQIQYEMSVRGTRCDLNHLDLTNVPYLGDLFRDSVFSGDISQWRMHDVQDARGMFANSMFDGDLSEWYIHPMMCIDGMFTCGFRGMLPSLYHVPDTERYGVYTTMFGSVEEFDTYLKDKPFGELHALAIIAGNVPSYLSPDHAQFLQDSAMVGSGLGLSHEELVVLLMEKYEHLQGALDLNKTNACVDLTFLGEEPAQYV